MLIVIAPLVFAAVSVATNVPTVSIGVGPITLLTPSHLTVQANAQVPATCTRASSSPSLGGLRVGSTVTIECKHGVLVSITAGFGSSGGFVPLFGPTLNLPGPVAIAGLPEKFGRAVPVPGRYPTTQQCVAAWNASAPLAARQALGIRPHSLLMSKAISLLSTPVINYSDSGHLIAKGPTCYVWFLLPGARAATVRSLWKDGAAEDWSGYVGSLGRVPTTVVTAPGWFSVSANGTLTS